MDLKIDLAVAEPGHQALSEITMQVLAHFASQFDVRSSGKYLQCVTQISLTDFLDCDYPLMAAPYRACVRSRSPLDGRALSYSRASAFLRFARLALTAAHDWGGRDRTFEYRIQRPVPYHLATPQRLRRYSGRDKGRVAFTVPKCDKLGKAFTASPSLPNIPKIALPLPDKAARTAPAFKSSLLTSPKRG